MDTIKKFIQILCSWQTMNRRSSLWLCLIVQQPHSSFVIGMDQPNPLTFSWIDFVCSSLHHILGCLLCIYQLWDGQWRLEHLSEGSSLSKSCQNRFCMFIWDTVWTISETSYILTADLGWEDDWTCFLQNMIP